MDEITLKRCSKCKAEKPISDFSRDSRTSDKLQLQCKECKARYYQARRNKYSEQQLQYQKAHQSETAKRHLVWQRNNRDKIREHWHQRRALKISADGSHTARELSDLLKAQNQKCAYCGIDLSSSKYELDHIVPLKHGGSNWINNLAWACRFCNRSKGDKLLSEWIGYRETQWQSFFS